MMALIPSAKTKRPSDEGVQRPSAFMTWKYRLWEHYLRLFPAAPSQFPPSWKIEPQDAKQLIIRWPTGYQWNNAHQWVGPIAHGMRRYVKVKPASLAQPYEGIVMVELVWREKPYAIAIDYSDDMEHIQNAAFQRAALYFKMQYRREGYGSDQIVPGGYVNPSDDYYKYIRWLRSVKDRDRSTFDVYGRFGLEFARQVRQRAVQILSEQNQFRYEGSTAIVRYNLSLEEAARSRICIDLPGKGDFCFRLIDYLGIGSCIVAAPPRTILHVPLENRKHIIYANEDLSDLVELCQYYLLHEDERNQIARNSRDFFEKYLHRDQLAAYYLFKSVQRCKAL